MSKKISELVELENPTNEDVLPVVNSSETKKITLRSLTNFLKDTFYTEEEIDEKLEEIEKSSYEQLVNYTMLYDGSLGESGESGANVCANLTGGYTGATTYSNLQLNSDSMHASCSLSGGGTIGVKTVNLVNLENYTSVYTQFSATSTKSGIRVFLKVADTAGASLIDSTKIETTSLNITKKIASINTINTMNLTTGKIHVEHNAYTTSSPTITLDVYNIFLTKSDDWQTLANKAGITATSIDEILTNSATLLNNEDAVNFMVKQCTGDFMTSAIQSETFLTALNNSSYKTTIQANEHWNKFLNMVA